MQNEFIFLLHVSSLIWDLRLCIHAALKLAFYSISVIDFVLNSTLYLCMDKSLTNLYVCIFSMGDISNEADLTTDTFISNTFHLNWKSISVTFLPALNIKGNVIWHFDSMFSYRSDQQTSAKYSCVRSGAFRTLVLSKTDNEFFGP